jgi:hypothetical protein
MKKLLAAALLAILALPASAYIEAMYPLQQMIAECEVIAEGVIEKADAKNKTAVAKITKNIKGKCHYEQIRMNLSGGQFWHSEVIMKHMVVGAPVVMLYNAGRQGEMYVNRFFIQLYGDAGAPPDKAWWNYTHIEIRCNRTYNGSAEDFIKLLNEIQAGKVKPPAPDARIRPISKEDVEKLPAWGEPADPDKLPPSFGRRDLAKIKPRDPENPANAVPGLKAEYYEGAWNALPDFNALKPVATTNAAVFDLSPKRRDEQIGLRFTGFIQVPKDGVYNFYTVSDDGSALWIGKDEIVNNDGLHGAVEMSGDAVLKAGKHAITVTFFENSGGEHLEVFWDGPDLPKQKIPAAALFRAP